MSLSNVHFDDDENGGGGGWAQKPPYSYYTTGDSNGAGGPNAEGGIMVFAIYGITAPPDDAPKGSLVLTTQDAIAEANGVHLVRSTSGRKSDGGDPGRAWHQHSLSAWPLLSEARRDFDCGGHSNAGRNGARFPSATLRRQPRPATSNCNYPGCSVSAIFTAAGPALQLTASPVGWAPPAPSATCQAEPVARLCRNRPRQADGLRAPGRDPGGVPRGESQHPAAAKLHGVADRDEHGSSLHQRHRHVMGGSPTWR